LNPGRAPGSFAWFGGRKIIRKRLAATTIPALVWAASAAQPAALAAAPPATASAPAPAAPCEMHVWADAYVDAEVSGFFPGGLLAASKPAATRPG